MELPYAAVEFTTKGEAADEQQAAAALATVKDAQATDVLLIAHGWNNDIPAAERLFERVIARLATEAQLADRRLAVIGVLWPSVRWADDDDLAGGGVSVADPRQQLDLAINQAVDDPAVAAGLLAAADRLETTGDGQEDFVAALRPLLPDADGGEDPLPQALAEGDAAALFAAAEEVELAGLDDEPDGAPGDADADLPPGVMPDLLGGPDTAAAGLSLRSPLVLARLLLNTSTYYTMKDRAGTVGSVGVAELARRLHDHVPDVAVHLAGHSFGARVVSAAAAASEVPLGSVTLLQGAFSHFGFARNYADSGKDGAFRRALTEGQVSGPIVVTHTHNDLAVRTAYALASRIARQTGAALVGGPDDPYGGIGANGARDTEEAESRDLQAADAAYDFTPGRVYNLRSDAFVGGHSRVTGPEVVHALAGAILAGGRRAP